MVKYSCLIWLICCSLFVSCSQEEDKYAENGNFGFSITEQDNGIALTWNQATLANFTEYIITKTSISTAVYEHVSEIKPEVIFARFNSRYTTSVLDTSLVFNSFYRLYINQGGKVIASAELFQKPNNYVLTRNSVVQMLVDYDKGNLYILNADQSVELVDLWKLELRSIYENILLPKSFSCSLGYDKDGNTEIYIPIADQIQVLDGERLNLKKSISNANLQVPIYNTITDENSNIFYSDATGGISSGIYKVDSKTKFISKFNVCGDCYHFNFMMSKDGKKGLVGSSGSLLTYFTLNDKNQISTLINSPFGISWSANQLFFVVASKSQTFIAGWTGIVYDLHFNFLKQFDQIGYVQSIFDENEDYIYVLGGINREVVKLENKVKYKRLGSVIVRSNPKQLFTFGGSIFVLGSVFDSSTGTTKLIIEKVKL